MAKFSRIEIVSTFKPEKELILLAGSSIKKITSDLKGNFITLNIPSDAPAELPRYAIHSSNMIIHIGLNRIQIISEPPDHIQYSIEEVFEFLKITTYKILNKIYESGLEYLWTGVITTIDYKDTSGSKTPFEAINPIFKKLLCLDWDKSDLASFNLQLGRKINDYFVNYNIHGYEKRKIKFNKDQIVKFDESKVGNEVGVQILLDINNKPMNVKKNPEIDLNKIILKQFKFSKSIEKDLNIEDLL